MPDNWYKQVTDEVEALVAATWTECAATAVKTQVQALSMNLVSQASAALAGDSKKISPPYAVIGIGKAVQENGISADAYYYRVPLKIWYLAVKVGATADTNATVQEWCMARALALLEAFQANSSTKWQLTGDDTGNADSSADVAFADESLKMYCSEVSFETGILVWVK